jgi:ribosomal protein S18 acetylase RimI-like enzyme
MALRLRSARAADAAIVAALHLASWRDTYRGMLGDEFLDGEAPRAFPLHWDATLARRPLPGLVMLATVSGDAAGFVAVWRRGEVALVDNLHVRPGLRSAGIGRTLLLHAAARMHRRGCRCAELSVFSGNARALRFYAALGAEIGEDRPGETFGQKVTERRCAWPAIERLIEVAAETGH